MINLIIFAIGLGLILGHFIYRIIKYTENNHIVVDALISGFGVLLCCYAFWQIYQQLMNLLGKQ